MDKSNISRAVQKLVDREWMKRNYDEADRRRHALELTSSGNEVFADLNVLAREHNTKIIEIVGKDKVKEFLDILSRIEATEFNFDKSSA